jgi:hypothetical protein
MLDGSLRAASRLLGISGSRNQDSEQEQGLMREIQNSPPVEDVCRWGKWLIAVRTDS